MTTGIFAKISACAAEEDAADGRKRITPWWRTLRAGGVLNEKYPGGAEAQKRMLEEEGHAVVATGKKYVVVDFDECLAKL